MLYFLGEEGSDLERIVQVLNENLAKSNIDAASCIQRAVCWTVKTSTSKVQEGKGSSNDKIIDGLASNEWIRNYFEGSMMEIAINHGLLKSNCSKEFSMCKLTQRSVQNIAKQFIQTFKER